jgi:hypothetical protein
MCDLVAHIYKGLLGYSMYAMAVCHNVLLSPPTLLSPVKSLLIFSLFRLCRCPLYYAIHFANTRYRLFDKAQYFATRLFRGAIKVSIV